MFNWFKTSRKYAYFTEVLNIVNENFRQDTDIALLKKELHGYQSALYSLCNALNLDLVKDEQGQVQVKQRVKIFPDLKEQLKSELNKQYKRKKK